DSSFFIRASPRRGSGGGVASANTRAAGRISPTADGARAQLVSTIGNAPAWPSTSINSAAGFSATTTIGPRSAMKDTPAGCHPTGGLLTARQRRAPRLAEGADHERIGAKPGQRFTDRGAVAPGTGEPLPGQRIGQHRQRGT